MSFKSDFEIAIRSIENDLSSRYDKLLDEKNEELTKQLERSIDLMDENEMIENELENLNIQIEEKNYLIRTLQENELIYQSEANTLKLQLNELQLTSNCDIIGFQFKINNTKDESTMCNISKLNSYSKSSEPFAQSNTFLNQYYQHN